MIFDAHASLITQASYFSFLRRNKAFINKMPGVSDNI